VCCFRSQNGASLILPMLALILGTPALAISEGAKEIIQSSDLGLIGTIGFILVQFVNAMARRIAAIQHRFRQSMARGVTQVVVLKESRWGHRRVCDYLVLMVFHPVRQLGTAMIASAGVAGIVIGYAAKNLAALLAGFQIAITQPIHRRCGHRRGSGENRRDHADLRRRVHLGPAPSRRAHHLFHREAVPELDAHHSGHSRNRVPSGGLWRARGSSRRSSMLRKLGYKVNVLQVTDAKEQTADFARLPARAMRQIRDLRCRCREARSVHPELPELTCRACVRLSSEHSP
jgi:hypothetical protein